MALICMGREVAFKLHGGREIEAPRRAGMLHDPDGRHWPKCSLLVAAFTQGREETDEGKNYFGRDAIVYEGHVELPPKNLDGWKKLGELKTVFYDRAGTKAPGYFKHQFNKPRGLFKLVFMLKGAGKEPAVLYSRGRTYRVELPENCIVDDRGYVYP